ncbi:WG repeat protein [Aquimarina sp. MAR_2010_214]|uniref:WG repeat-containing protein n=1 Tax=Aquimarina sp. MAR_2010_214 TaxID=1250026 RepID=UPI000C70E5A8|nr:WG repeat-containing protein [Aquimarina sp. MAR_2010_214]PKV50636.1 WG repeat protein [Aquimarina sp. MAR_2010_214]
MKNSFLFITCVILLSFTSKAQIITDIDEITPFHEKLAAIKKDGKWAFINPKGEIVIDYRDDLVTTTIGKQSYPLFKGGKCIIKQMVEEVHYYGYIDIKGKITIKPEYINAINFDQGHAIVLKLEKEKLGENKILGKNVVSYTYNEVVIDTLGNEKAYLVGPIHIDFKKTTIKTPPAIQSHILSSNLAVMKTKDKGLQIHRLKKSN